MNKDLKEWTTTFVYNKDLNLGRIVKVDANEKDSSLNIIYKDKPNRHYILDKLDESIIGRINNNDSKTIVCPNTDENFNALVKHWKRFVLIKNLNIIFVNMKTHDKWIINPKLHAMIADPTTVAAGLKTMFDTANGKIADIKRKKTIFEDGSDIGEEEKPEDEDDPGEVDDIIDK